jgi:hypothetical protein
VIIPAATLLMLFAVVSIVCLVTLWITRWPGFRVATLITFIVCAYFGEIWFFKIYGSLYADANGELTTRSSVLRMFACVPIVAAVCGWLGAAAAALAMRYIERPPSVDEH